MICEPKFKAGDRVVGNLCMTVTSNTGRQGTVVSCLDTTAKIRWDDGDVWSEANVFKLDLLAPEPTKDTVTTLGNEIIATLTERGKQYDASGKGAERSMKKIVTAFNAITGKDLTAVEGWAFMQVLKQVRFFSNTSAPHRDSLIDNGAYALLQAEEALDV